MDVIFPKKSLRFRILFSLLIVACALFFQIKYHDFFKDPKSPLIGPSIFLAAWIAGFYPAAIALVISALTVYYIYFLENNYEAITQDQIIKLVIFLIINLLIAKVVSSARKKYIANSSAQDSLSEKLHFTIENMLDAFCALDSAKRVILVNKTHEKITNTKREEVIGKFIWEVFPEIANDKNKFATEFNKSISSKVAVEFEEYYPYLNIWLEVRFTPTNDGGTTIFYRDISLRKATEKHFHNLADSMPQIVFIEGKDDEFQYLNKNWYQYTGIELGNKDEIKWNEIIHSEDYNAFFNSWKEGVESKNTFSTECRLKRHDDIYRWHLLRAIPIKNNDHIITNWYGTFTDIDEQINTKNDLEAALKVRDEFLSIASHELKTPLTSLKLHSQMFNKNITNNDPEAFSKEKIEKFALQLDKQVIQLNRLMDNMFEISQIRSNNFKIKPTTFNFFLLAEEIINDHIKDFVKHNYPIPSLIADNEMIEVHWDKEKIQKVIENLLSNSIRYGEKKQVTLKVSAKNEFVFIAVFDQGKGIASTNIERILDRFEKITHPEQVTGLGLGLFISNQIIKAHGGMITINSELNNGSEFVVKLPKKISLDHGL